jgi:hypothetical protein
MLLYCCDYIIFVFDDSFLTNDNYSLYNDRPLSYKATNDYYY